MKIIDLFCGIGGVAEATRQWHDAGQRATDPTAGQRATDPTAAGVIAAIDIDRDIGPIYRDNHGIAPLCRTLESIRELPMADLWWLSPPCQPYTRRGRGSGDRDPRSQALSHLIQVIGRERPAKLVLENVPPFAGSVHHRQLGETLRRAGYSFRQDVLCPTQWGVPMRRRRFYLRARIDGKPIAEITPQCTRKPIAAFLDASAWHDLALHLSAENRTKYRGALHRIDADDSSAVTACFTSAYGKSVVRAGSYVHCRQRNITRKFSPHEIARLMGFRAGFRWTSVPHLRRRYSLVGNSLAVPVVRALLESLRA